MTCETQSTIDRASVNIITSSTATRDQEVYLFLTEKAPKGVKARLGSNWDFHSLSKGRFYDGTGFGLEKEPDTRDPEP